MSGRCRKVVSFELIKADEKLKSQVGLCCVCDRDFVTRSRERGGRGTCRGWEGRERRGRRKREVCNASMRWVSNRWVDEEQRPEHVSRSSWSTAHPPFPSFNFCFFFFLSLYLFYLYSIRSLRFFFTFFSLEYQLFVIAEKKTPPPFKSKPW